MSDARVDLDLLDEAVAAVSRGGPDRWRAMGAEVLESLLERVEAASRRLRAVACAAAAESARRHEAQGRSTGSAAARLGTALGVPTGEARRRIEAGRREGTAGMDSLRMGRISAAQEAAVARWLAELPESASVESREAFARHLTEWAEAGSGVRQIGARAERALVEIDPGRQLRSGEIQQRRRAARMSDPAVDGTSHVGLTCTPELRALIDAVLARFGGPGSCIAPIPDPLSGEVPSSGLSDTARDDVAASDTRTPEQRAHDAFRDVVELGLAAGPVRPRGVASIVVRVSPEQLDAIDSGGGVATTDAGTDLSVRQAVAMAEGRSWFVSALRDGREELRRIDVDGGGGRRRLASTLQRLVLYAAHGGCTHPGCSQPAARCQAHHVHEHRRGGPTTLPNAIMA